MRCSTRSQAQQKEWEEEIRLAKELTSGVRPRSILELGDDGAGGANGTLVGVPDVEQVIEESEIGESVCSKKVEASQVLGEEVSNVGKSEVVQMGSEGAVKESPPMGFSTEELKHQQREDKSLSNIHRFVDVPTDTPMVTACFRWKEGMLYRQWHPRGSKERDVRQVEQIVLPMSYRRKVLEIAHSVPMAGHLGQRKTAHHVLQQFYWPNVFHDVAEYCRTCDACQRTGRKRTSDWAPATGHL